MYGFRDGLKELGYHAETALGLFLGLILAAIFAVFDKFMTFMEICEGSKKLVVVTNPDYVYPIK